MWKTIKDFPNYQVSDKGEIKNIKTNRILKQSYNQDGYAILQLTDGYKPKMKRVHRLVLETFNPIENSDEYEVNHKDRNIKNNALDNLEWVTSKQNIQYRDTDDNPNKKNQKIKVEFATGEIQIFDSIHECARYFKLHPTTILDYIDKKLTTRRKIQANFTRI